jgi:hypothetical protein
MVRSPAADSARLRELVSRKHTGAAAKAACRRPPQGRSRPERRAPPATRSGHHPARPAAAHQRRASRGPTPAGHHHPAERGAGRRTPPMRPQAIPRQSGPSLRQRRVNKRHDHHIPRRRRGRGTGPRPIR